MNILRRRSSAKGGGGGMMGIESQLLAEVQNCCSKQSQHGFSPDDASIARAMSQLMETSERQELEKVLRFLGNELRSDSHKTKMLALGTLGMLMRTDHAEFQRLLSTTNHILKQMQAIIEQRKKSSAKTEVVAESDLALQLVECWAVTIEGENDTLEIEALYKELKKKEWIRWPARNHKYDCRQDYDRDVSVDPDAPPPPRKPASLRPSSLRTFSSQDTAWMRRDFDQFDQLLTSFEAELSRARDSEDISQNILIPELIAECDKIGPQLRSMIEIVSHTIKEDPDALNPLLEMNDRLLRVIEKYKKLKETPPSTKDVYNPFDDEVLVTQVLSQMPPQPFLQPVSPRSGTHQYPMGGISPSQMTARQPPPVTTSNDPWGGLLLSSPPIAKVSSSQGMVPPLVNSLVPMAPTVTAPSRPPPQAPYSGFHHMAVEQNPFGNDDDLL